MQKVKKHGLVGDLWPHIQLMKATGMWLFNYYEHNGPSIKMFRVLYATATSILMLAQFASILAFLILDCSGGDQLASGTITFLFFAHSIGKYMYFAFRAHLFYRLLGSWNQINSHPLFTESHTRHRLRALKRMRRLLLVIGVGTIVTVFAWTSITFVGESTLLKHDTANNHSELVHVPRFILYSHYFWDVVDGTPTYFITFCYQMVWLLFALSHANLLDVFFCCTVIFGCEQLIHLKEIMRPLMELSAALDTAMPNANRLFRTSFPATAALGAGQEDILRNIYTNMPNYNNEFSQLVTPRVGPNGLTKKHEVMVRSAIKYWVERHKHVVKYVTCIGEAYGSALLLHMLISTVTLTLLAYQATKIDNVDLFAVRVVGYLFYSLAQVFLFCIYGNELIEESSSVMEAAYSCHWYDGSEEAKTFVQIVCQQCQKSLTVSGAKFFTVSLDLFASVLGAVVTYFMVLIQLK